MSARARYLWEWHRARRRLWLYHEGRLDLCSGELCEAIADYDALVDTGSDPACRASWQLAAANAGRNARSAAYRAHYWGERAPGSQTVRLAIRHRAEYLTVAREALISARECAR